MVGWKRRVEWNVLPDVYKGFDRLHKTLILKMETALSAETLETHQQATYSWEPKSYSYSRRQKLQDKTIYMYNPEDVNLIVCRNTGNPSAFEATYSWWPKYYCYSKRQKLHDKTIYICIILKMETALPAETLITYQYSKLLIPDSWSLTVTPDAKNFRIKICIYNPEDGNCIACRNTGNLSIFKTI
jgi:hypothetical protein